MRKYFKPKEGGVAGAMAKLSLEDGKANGGVEGEEGQGHADTAAAEGGEAGGK
jgi:hypothetical protein